MFVKKEGQYDLAKDIDVKISSDKNYHYISIYDDKKNKSVAFSTDNNGLKGLADFIYRHLGIH
jgi:hypothetical protein